MKSAERDDIMKVGTDTKKQTPTGKNQREKDGFFRKAGGVIGSAVAVGFAIIKVLPKLSNK